MAVGPLQLPGMIQSSAIDFSPLAQLGQVYQKAQTRQTLAELGKGLSDGTIDYKQAAGIVSSTGDLDATTKFLALAQAAEKQKLQQQAGAQFSNDIGGIFGGQPTAQPQPQPGMRLSSLGAAPPVNTPRTTPVQSSPRVWGDQEAEAAGLYETPAKAVVQVAPRVDPAPQVAPQPFSGQIGVQHIPKLMEAVGNPNLLDGQKDLAKTLLTRALDASKPNERIQMLTQMKRESGFQGSLLELEERLRAAGKTTVNIDQKGETKFEEELGKGQAKRWNEMIEGGSLAERKLVDINSMRQISQRMGSQGAQANIKEAIGPYAEALGVNLDGLSDIQAYSSIVQRLAPQQRAAGSGSTSDIEFKGFLKSLPTLTQNPAARDMTLNTMEALTRDEIARGQIASRLATKEISRVQAEKELRALPDPMTGFVEWRKSNAGAYGQALKAGPNAGGMPKAGHVEDGYRFKGGDPSNPSNWVKQ